jgi:peptide/nickel transport system substrate-binding protein
VPTSHLRPDGALRTGLSRRAFLTRTGAAGMVTLVAALGVSAPAVASASAYQQATPAPDANTSWAPAPVTLVYADSADISHIDPALGVDFWSFTAARNMYEPLVEIDETNQQLVPGLATSWDVSPDGTSYTFHLRDGVKFTDGSSLDANTVKLNLDRTVQLKQGPAYLINNFKDVSVVDPMTVTITTTAPDPYVPAHLVKVGIVSGQAIMSHQTSDDPWAQNFLKDNAVGSGPFTLSDWQHGSQLTLVKNPNWWGQFQPGSLDKIIIKVVEETAPRVQMIERGEADLINQWPASEALRVGTEPNFQLLEFTTYDTEPIFYMYTLKPPFDNKLMRQAMQYAFDYSAMIDYYQGHAVTPTGPIPPDYPGGAQDLEPFQQNLDMAAQLIKQSGVDTSSLNLDFPIAGAGGDQFEAGATILQAALQGLGIQMAIRKMPFAQWTDIYSKPETSGNITDLVQSPFTLDPTQFLAFYYPDNFFNMARLNNPDIVAAIDQIKTTLDPNQRNSMLHDIQHTIRDEAPCIWGCRPKTLVAVPNYIDGYVMQSTDYRWSMDFKTIRMKAH